MKEVSVTTTNRENSNARLRISDLSVRIGTKSILSKLSFEIPEGEFVALLGVSGAGKSTLLKAMIGEISGLVGRVEGPARFGYAPQRSPLLPWLSVLENLRLAIPSSMSADDGEARIRDLMQRAHLEGAGDLKPGALSGGMRSRVSVLRAFLMSEPVILMDEPFVGLDVVTREALHGLTRALARETRATTLFVSHDIDEALRLADRIMVLKKDGTGFCYDRKSQPIEFSLGPAQASMNQDEYRARWTAIYEALRES